MAQRKPRRWIERLKLCCPDQADLDLADRLGFERYVSYHCGADGGQDRFMQPVVIINANALKKLL